VIGLEFGDTPTCRLGSVISRHFAVTSNRPRLPPSSSRRLHHHVVAQGPSQVGYGQIVNLTQSIQCGTVYNSRLSAACHVAAECIYNLPWCAVRLYVSDVVLLYFIPLSLPPESRALPALCSILSRCLG